MKKTKKIISLLLTIQMLLSCVLIPSATATDSVVEEPIDEVVEAIVIDEGESSEELSPMMARACDNNDYSQYDGLTFGNTSHALNTMGISFSGSGLDIVLSNPNHKIAFNQDGTDLCVHIINKVTDKLICWFKVRGW